MRGLDPRIHLAGKKSLSKDAMGFELRHRFDVELRIIEQRQMDLMAHCRNVGLIEYQLGGLPPALAAFAASGRQRQHVVGGLTDRSQDAPVLGRKGLSEILGEVRGGQRQGAYLSGCRQESN
jgi:hypothetical protein